MEASIIREGTMDKSVFDRFPFYAGMSEEDKKLLQESVMRKDISEGQIMMGDNNRCSGIPMVMKGRLRLFRISEKGREMTIYRINEGELCLLAGVCAMGNTEYDFSIEAEKDSVLANIPPDTFKELIYRSDSFRTYVFNALAQKLILSIETIEMLIFNSIEERIMAYLQRHANAQSIVKTTHEKLAVELGSSREVITRQLKSMSERGLLELRRGKIIVKIRCD
jgi:CRP/FNR family transcriptional regulator